MNRFYKNIPDQKSIDIILVFFFVINLRTLL